MATKKSTAKADSIRYIAQEIICECKDDETAESFIRITKHQLIDDVWLVIDKIRLSPNTEVSVLFHNDDLMWVSDIVVCRAEYKLLANIDTLDYTIEYWELSRYESGAIIQLVVPTTAYDWSGTLALITTPEFNIVWRYFAELKTVDKLSNNLPKNCRIMPYLEADAKRIESLKRKYPECQLSTKKYIRGTF